MRTGVQAISYSYIMLCNIIVDSLLSHILT